jgi:hypothetical protein
VRRKGFTVGKFKGRNVYALFLLGSSFLSDGKKTGSEENTALVYGEDVI